MTPPNPTPSSSKAAPLALEGGAPVRRQPLPLEFPGGYFIDDKEIAAVTRVLKNQSPFRYYGLKPARQTETFEAEFAQFCGRKYALGVSSGTAALSVGLAALGVGPGQEVLIPGYFWVSTAACVVRAGAIPVLVDIDDTFCMDPADLEKKITSKSTVIMPVHMSGAAGRLDAILRLARQKKLKVLADCAQANGSSFQGKPIGKYGDIAIFSLQLNKNMTTGEGGLLVCDDKMLYQRAFAAHDLGYARKQGRLDTSDLQLWGQGCRMSELTAAMGRVQLRKLPRIVGAMKKAKYQIKNALAHIPQLQFRRIMDPAGDSGVFLITIFPDNSSCQRFVKALRAEGIVPKPGGISNIPMTEWGLHIYYNNTALVRKASISGDGYPWTHPANRDSVHLYSKGTLPQTDELIARSSILAIPPVLTGKDIRDIVKAYHKVAAALS